MITYAPDTLKKIMLKDRYNHIIFEKGKGREIYLVGGYVRDALRGSSSSDRDFIVNGNLKSFVYEVRDTFGGTLVQFKKDNMIRVALQERVTFDFSGIEGTLREDLSKRDFTINAIAWSPDGGIVDYYGGQEDIRKKIVRAISEDNIISDPLRMIRAYRFAAEMNGSIDLKTRKIIKTFHNRIKGTSSERITSEVFNLLNSESPSIYLKMALDDDLLARILPFTFRKLVNNIRSIAELERITFSTNSRTIKVLLDGPFAQNLTHRGLLSLGSLLYNCSLSKVIEALTLSNKIIKRIALLHRGMKACDSPRDLSADILFDVFMKSKEASKDVLLIKGRTDLFGAFNKFKRIWSRGLLSSEEIIDISGLKTGPVVGKSIEKVKKAQFERKIRTRSEARAFVKRLVLHS